MPTLRKLTISLKTKFCFASPPASPSSSTTSFEVVGGAKVQNEVKRGSVQYHKIDSFLSEEWIDAPSSGKSKAEKRTSKFREEFQL